MQEFLDSNDFIEQQEICYHGSRAHLPRKPTELIYWPDRFAKTWRDSFDLSGRQRTEDKLRLWVGSIGLGSVPS